MSDTLHHKLKGLSRRDQGEIIHDHLNQTFESRKIPHQW